MALSSRNIDMEFVFATKNSHKLEEIREIIKGSGIEIISLAELDIDINVEEDGATFEENALKKAREAALASGRPALADDSGLEIDFLDKAPGVYSARFMGENTPYDVKNARLLEMLGGVPYEKRTARFVCAAAAAIPTPGGLETFCERGVIEGHIHDRPEGENGFGYDPIFFADEFGMTTARMPAELKNRVSHRGKALARLCRAIKN